MSYRTAGSGPPLLLLHGIANSSETWERVAPLLSEHFTLIAPDLLGHGESATPRGDYSLGAHASGARDIVTALGHERVTVVGHSLGGGIAMQFAYQFPERAERLVLVSSGGLGREVHLVLRAASLPGADLVLPALTSGRVVGLGREIGSLLGRVGLAPGGDLGILAKGEEYFQERGLRRHAGVWSLWALGVAAVISGDFSGWNFGLGGRFGGLASPPWSSRSCISGSATASRRCRRRCRIPAVPTASRVRRWGRGAGSSPGWRRTSSTW